MSLYLSVPLPGPFRYSHRLTSYHHHYVRVHRSRFNTLWYWFLGVWMLEAMFWVAVGSLIMYGVTAVGIVWLVRWMARQPQIRRGFAASVVWLRSQFSRG